MPTSIREEDRCWSEMLASSYTHYGAKGRQTPATLILGAYDMTIKSGGKKDYHSVCYLNKDKDSTVCFDIKYGNGYAYADTEKKKKLLENMIMEENAVYNALSQQFLRSHESGD